MLEHCAADESVDILSGMLGQFMYNHLTCGVAGRDAGGEGQWLQSWVHSKCITKPKLHYAQFCLCFLKTGLIMYMVFAAVYSLQFILVLSKLLMAEMKMQTSRVFCACAVFCTGEPLYDWSGRALSDQEFQMLFHYQMTFQHLITVFHVFHSCSSTATDSGEHS